MSWFSFNKSKADTPQALQPQQVEQCLAQFQFSPLSTALHQRITHMQIEQDTLQLSIFVYPDEAEHLQQLHDELSAELQKIGVHTLWIHAVQKKAEVPPTTDAGTTTEEVPVSKATPTQSQLKPHPHIRHVIVIASGKGGVGKSTTTVNLALALKKLGLKVGVLDADIYGPSVPTMLGNEGQTPLIENEQFIPLDAYGMPVLSIGHLTGDAHTPIAWRGPKATGALMQLFNQTQWPQLDVLLIDMPPGTGDIQLTLAQRIPVSAAIIVTTPQNVALKDAQKGIELFNKVNINIMGVIENMSTHICSNCGHEEQIFGTGGGQHLADHYHIPLLGRLPLNVQIRENADKGKPSVIAQDAAYESYMDIARSVKKHIEQLPTKHDEKRIF